MRLTRREKIWQTYKLYSKDFGLRIESRANSRRGSIDADGVDTDNSFFYRNFEMMITKDVANEPPTVCNAE